MLMRKNSLLVALLLTILPLSALSEEVPLQNYNPQEPEAEAAPADSEAEAPDADSDVKTAKPLKAENTGSVVDQNMEEGDVEAEEDSDQWYPRKQAVLQGLNKVTARTSELKTLLNEKIRFGNLEIMVEKCLRGPQDEKEENTALITIWDEIPGQERAQVFRGWMFSSSPAISALEHPIYDVILLSCGNPKTAVKTPSAKPVKTPEKK